MPQNIQWVGNNKILFIKEVWNYTCFRQSPRRIIEVSPAVLWLFSILDMEYVFNCICDNKAHAMNVFHGISNLPQKLNLWNGRGKINTEASITCNWMIFWVNYCIRLYMYLSSRIAWSFPNNDSTLRILILVYLTSMFLERNIVVWLRTLRIIKQI